MNTIAPYRVGFLTPPPSVHHIRRDLAITLSDQRWRDPDGREHDLPRGFPTDGGSVPIAARRKWDPWEPKIFPAAVWHDAGYSLQGTEFDLGPKHLVDARFRAGLNLLGFQASTLFWRAVQIGGVLAWHTPNIPEVDHWLFCVRNGTVDAWIQHWTGQKAVGSNPPPCDQH